MADPHKIRRLATVLVTSQLRSGRTSSNPRSLLGRPGIIAAVDAALFLGTLALIAPALPALGSSAATWKATVNALLPFLPLAAVGIVLIAGTMFELTANAKFSGSDAVNWLPLRPGEYVAGSALAIAYTYSPAISLLFGGLLPFTIADGTVPAYVLAVSLSALSLFEGALLVEMIRAASARAGSAGTGRRGPATFLARAVLLVVVILVLDLALNPVILFGFVQHLTIFPEIAAAVPLFWSSRAIASWTAGAAGIALAFAVAQVAFVALLAWLAARLRARYWVPVASEVDLGEHRYAGPHPLLAALGLSRPERALVSKDLKGLVRRRELLPMLVVPIVLVLLLAIEGSSFGTFTIIIWLGWVAGFFGLLLSTTSVGQERRALAYLFALPVAPRTVFRAKIAATLVPVLLGSVLVAAAAGAFFRFAPLALAGTIALTGAVALLLVLWGLIFASRYSDFQERPRPQFLRPFAMIEATISGLLVLVAVVIPAAFALAHPVASSLGFAIASVAIAATVGALAYGFARRGFDGLFRELPF
jgi:predicted permease